MVLDSTGLPLEVLQVKVSAGGLFQGIYSQSANTQLVSPAAGQDREWVYNRDKIVIKGKLRVRVPEISPVVDL